jgi:hypothetical protein
VFPKGVCRYLKLRWCQSPSANQALHDTGNVYIHGDLSAVASDCCDGASGVRTDPREFLKCLNLRRDAAQRLCSLRCTMQEECTTVVPETSPRLQHIRGLRACERTKRWETPQKLLGEYVHSRNLCLLRHHLNDEHRIRITSLANLEPSSTQLVPGK